MCSKHRVIIELMLNVTHPYPPILALFKYGRRQDEIQLQWNSQAVTIDHYAN